jgi:hypothetical protein
MRDRNAPPVESAPAARGLGFLLAPVHGSVLLASRAEAFAPDVAPIVQVLADGSLALRRPAPRAQRPEQTSSPDTDAGILLPARSLQGLGPDARAALLDVIGQLVAERPVPSARVRAVDVAAVADLDGLLSWVR